MFHAVRVADGVLCRMRVFELRVVSRVPRERADEGLVVFCEVAEQKDGYEVFCDKVVLQDFCWLRCASGWRTLPRQEGANFNSRRMADLVDDCAVHQLKEFDGTDQEFVIEGLSYNVSSMDVNVAEDFSVPLELGITNAEEVAEGRRRRLTESWKFSPREVFMALQSKSASPYSCLTAGEIYTWLTQQSFCTSVFTIDDVAEAILPFAEVYSELRYEGFLRMVLPSQATDEWLRGAIIRRPMSILHARFPSR